MKLNIKYTFRLLLPFITVFILLSTFFYFYNMRVRDDLVKTQKELIGVEYINHMQALGANLQNIRGLYILKKNDQKGRTYHRKIDTYVAQSRKLILKLTNLPPAQNAVFNIEFKSLLNSINVVLKKDVVTTQYSWSYFEKISSSIILLNHFNLKVGDQFLLFFDPDVDSYYLMILLLEKIPLYKEDLAKLRGLGTQVVGHRGKRSKDLELLKFNQSNLEMNLRHIEEVFYLIKYEDSKGLYDLTNKFKGLKNNIGKLLPVLQRDVFSEKILIQPQDYFRILSDSLYITNEFFLSISFELNRLLHKRKERLIQEEIVSFSLYAMIVCLLIVVYVWIVLNSYKKNIAKKESRGLLKLKHSLMELDYVQEVCEVGLEYISRIFDAEKGLLYLANQENKKLYLGATFAESPRNVSAVLEWQETIVGQVANDHKPHTQERVSGGSHVKYICTYPVKREDRIVGVLQLFVANHIDAHRDFFLSLLEVYAWQIIQKSSTTESKKMANLLNQNIITSQTNVKGVIVSVSKAFADISEYKKEELLGKNHNIVRHPDMPKEIFVDLWNTINKGEVWRGEVKNKTKSGGYYWVDVVISPNKDFYGNIIGFTALRQDITNKKKVEELSLRDSMTGLYNRRFFDQKFSSMIKENNKNAKMLCFGILDVDNFKLYNDHYGHQKGDEALITIAHELINNCGGNNQWVFRLGGEEFGFLILSDSKKDVETQAERVRASIENLKIEHEKNTASGYLTVSIGVFINGSGLDHTQEEMYKLADQELYAAKEGGRNRFNIQSSV